MVNDPALGLFLVLTVLEAGVDDDSKIVTGGLLVLEGVDIVLLDEEDAFLIACKWIAQLSVIALCVGTEKLFFCHLKVKVSVRTLVLVDEGN